MHYYNEFDPKAAAWLRELIKAGEIPKGDVDERSIADVQADDLRGYVQCHFFAGIGGWPLALRLAGWPEDRPCWTGSCPCQPFSSAGKRRGVADERHLWPVWFRLIRECRPVVIFGEQVSSAIRHGWLDGVCSDMEAEGYAVGACVFGAHSVGAPHIRQRLWWLAEPRCVGGERRQGQQRPVGENAGERNQEGVDDQRGGTVGRLADAGHARGQHEAERQGRGNADGLRGRLEHTANDGRGERRAESIGRRAASGCGAGRLEHTKGQREDSERGCQRQGLLQPDGSGTHGRLGDADSATEERFGPVGVPVEPEQKAGRSRYADHWSNAILIGCADGKSRRIEPGLEPLVARVSDNLERMRSAVGSGCQEIQKAAEEMSNGTTSKRSPDEILRMVQEAVRQEPCREEQPIGVPLKLSAQEVLLHYLLCVEAAFNGTADESGIPQACHEAQRRIVRSLRLDGRNSCSSRRWRPSQQQSGKPANTLHLLPFVLARHAEAYWEAAMRADAANNRVVKLRGYGNAIVPQAAAEFIKAYLETGAGR